MKKWLIAGLFFALTIGWIWYAIFKIDYAYGVFPRPTPAPLDVEVSTFCEKISQIYAEKSSEGVIYNRCYNAVKGKAFEKYWGNSEKISEILSSSFEFNVDPSVITLTMSSS